MTTFKLFAATAVLTATLMGPAFAQDAREAEIIGLHQLCDHGDRKACVHFGMMMQQNHDRAEAWHHTHPEWFWWEH
jgi:hypothetical protein